MCPVEYYLTIKRSKVLMQFKTWMNYKNSMVISKEAQLLVFAIPIFEPLPSQYYIQVVSDRRFGAEAVCIINFQHLILPDRHQPHTGNAGCGCKARLAGDCPEYHQPRSDVDPGPVVKRFFSSFTTEHRTVPSSPFQAWNFLSHLPVIDVGISVKGSWNDLAEGHNELSVSTLTADKRDDNKWVRLHADQEYVLQVSLQRVHFGFHKVLKNSENDN
ncbi:uncharacterized protein ACOB7L_007138 [Callospermophilus lateralis]|uniref:uncharacterized protein LOC143640804 n=1 Tax=Callospermophilus lateralis TaxID=76772 RepID=UPI0040545C16